MAFHRDIVAFHSHAGTVLVASGADPEIAVWKKRLNQRRFPPAGAQVLRHARDSEMSKVRVLLFEADGRSHHRTDVRAMQAIEHAIESGRLSAVYLPTHAVHRHGSGDLVGSPRLTITPTATRGRAPTVGGMDGPNRLLFMLQRMPRFLGGPMLAAFNDLVSTRSLMALAASLVVFTLAQAVGVGEALDAALAAWAYSRARIAGLQALWDLLVACHDAWDAQSEGEIDAAGKRFAAALTVLGIALLSAILVFAARRLRGGKVEEEPEQIQRVTNKNTPESSPATPPPDETIDFYHGSKNLSTFKNGKLDPNRDGAFYAAREEKVAQNAINHHVSQGDAPKPGMVKASIPKSEIDALKASGDIKVRSGYPGFFPANFDAEEYMFITPAAKELFNRFIK